MLFGNLAIEEKSRGRRRIWNSSYLSSSFSVVAGDETSQDCDFKHHWKIAFWPEADHQYLHCVLSTSKMN